MTQENLETQGLVRHYNCGVDGRILVSNDTVQSLVSVNRDTKEVIWGCI